MKIYLVGGAVRDQLLNLPVKERDYLVTGATPQEMLSLGFKQVGKDFPVFLHPKTKEEYALARTERKTAKGYLGFKCFSEPTVTIEEDLKRRDLTINAMAIDENKMLIDPYGGEKDLKRKILRHVSMAFVEDPVRILRVARFAAYLPSFSIAKTTLNLMKKMLQEIDSLVPERVWQEWRKAFNTKAPFRFLATLKKIKALDKLFPNLAPFYYKINGYFKTFPSDFITKYPFQIIFCSVPILELKKFFTQYHVPKTYQEQAKELALLKKIRKNASKATILTHLEQSNLYRNPNNLIENLTFLTLFLPEKSHLFERIKLIFQISKTIKILPQELTNLSPLQIKKYLHQKRLKQLILLLP